MNNKIELPSFLGKGIYVTLDDGGSIFEISSENLPNGSIKMLHGTLCDFISFSIKYFDGVDENNRCKFKKIITEREGLQLVSEIRKSLIPSTKDVAELFNDAINKINAENKV